MGIRIHKAVGYGLRNFSPPKGWQDKCNTAYEISLEDFIKFCHNHKEKILSYTIGDRSRTMMFEVDLDGIRDDNLLNRSLGEYLLFDDEYGFSDALLFLPPGYKNWKRIDDTIDYCEEMAYLRTIRDSELEPRFLPLPYGIYPHDKGKPPLTVIALALWFEIPEIIPQLTEALYLYWS